MKNRTLMAIGLAIVAPLLTTSSLAQSLKGSLKDFKSGYLTLCLEDVGLPRAKSMDTILVKNGSFSYNLKMNTATRVVITPLREEVKGEKSIPSRKYMEVILVPGEQAVVSGTFDNFRVGGTAFFLEYQKAHAPLDVIRMKRKALFDKYKKLLNGTSNNSIERAYSKEVSMLSDAHKKEILAYIRKHPDSDVSTALIAEIGMDSMEEGIALLTVRAREGRLSPLYKSGLKISQERKAKEQRAKKMEGKPAPIFALPGLDGKIISLESFHGKYVVVDFWGSWCGWCIKGIPEMKTAYNKYRQKMEIISVDCRDTEEKWHKAVVEHDMPWTHVRCADGCDLPTQYNVIGYPTKCIVDPNGNIVKICIGESPDFYELLDKLFQ